MEDSTKEIENIREAYRKLMFYVGKCTSDYQKIEDHLPLLFSEASLQSEDVALQIFGLGKGLETKLSMVTAVMLDRDEQLSDLWFILKQEIKWAFDQRNIVAHSVLATWGGVQRIDFDDDGKAIFGPRDPEAGLVMIKGQFDRDKMRKVGDLKDISDRIEPIFDRLMILYLMLQGKKLPGHLKSKWDHVTVKNWPEK